MKGHVQKGYVVCVAIVACIALAGCGAGSPSAAQIDRSQKEVQLASSLRQEGSSASAITHLRTAIKLNPNNAEAYLLLGFIQMESRRFDQAEVTLHEGIEVLKKNERQGATLAEARNIYGLCLMELGRYEDATAALLLSAQDELNTAPHLAWGNLGLVYLRNKQPRQAVEATVEATRLQPRFCVGYETMGTALVELGELEKAEQAFVAAIDADEECATSPALQRVWRMRGEVRAKLGHRHDAVADLERCVELSPRTSEGILCHRRCSKRIARRRTTQTERERWCARRSACDDSKANR
ncbi:MAG: tetratricopeptide repeat protein [Polyangiales bacterium]